MKIQQIIGLSNHKMANVRRETPVFKGLWGEDTYYEQHDSTYDIEDTTCHYYPFKDESNEEIYRARDKYYRSGDCRMGGGSDPHCCYSGVSVEVHEKLPFTAKEFKAYMENRLHDLRKKVIEHHIMEKKLSIHI